MTDYRLADGGRDYKKVHDLVKSEGFPDSRLTFPTLMAVKDGELVGCFASRISNSQLIGGPLVVRSDRPRYWTLIRLVDMYENVLRACGVTNYLVNVDLDKAHWLDMMREVYNMQHVKDRSGEGWYRRTL